MDLGGDADVARLGQGLQAGGNVHSVAVDVALLHDDVAEADAEPQPDASVLGGLPLEPDHARLDLDRAVDRVDDAGELAQ